MAVGPTETPHERKRELGMDSLFDRIASELAESADNDDTTETWRPPSPDDISGAMILPGSKSWPAPDISTQIERPLAADRQCSRSGCSNAAAVTLSYHYGQSQVWIDRLWPEREPHMYDMCEQHAERLSVPRGWHLDDRRGSRHAALIAV